MENKKHKVFFREKSTKRLLRTFEYPSGKILGKFFWEKIKQEELTKLLRARDLAVEDVIGSEIIEQ